VFLTTESISENAISKEEDKKRLRDMVDETLKMASKLHQD